MTVLATDTDFPIDLEAWCRSTGSSLVRLEHEDGGVIRAQVRVGRPSPGGAAAKGSAGREPGTTLLARAATSDVAGRTPLPSPAAPTGTAPSTPPGPSVASPDSAPRGLVLPAPAPAPAAAPRESRTTLLVISNDLEKLLAALMVANASAAQGMRVEVFFSFWGIHLLRGEGPRPFGAEEKPGLLQRILLWMLPRGPARQGLGKMHMGGLGTRILLRIMRRRNILALDKLVEAAVSQGVKFRVCSMSMGLMGLGERDIVQLPNIDFAGVTTFAEVAARSSVSLVF